MGVLRELRAYLGQMVAELRRLDAYYPDSPAGSYPRLAREFLEMSMPVDQAAAWLAAGAGPSVVRLLIAQGLTPPRWTAYVEHMQTHAHQLNGPELAMEWILAGQPAIDAAAWATLGYRPDEAAPLIAEGVTPAMAGIGHNTANPEIRPDAGTDAELRAELLRRDDLLIDPDLADRLGLDQPHPHHHGSPLTGDTTDTTADAAAETVIFEVINIQIGHPRYEELIGQIRGNSTLLAQMWADAEHKLDEHPNKIWTVVVVADGDRKVPAAWAAATVEHRVDGPILRCSDNYECRGPGRDHGLYAVAYAHRHRTVVEPAGIPAVTYLFAQPIARHEADGWYRTTTCSDPGVEPHDWWELRRKPGPTGS